MRMFKLAGAVVLVLAFSAVAVATASAAEVLWRWLPGAAATKFTGKSGKATLQVKGGIAITAPESTTAGEITESLTLGKATFTFVKATAGGLPVNSLGDASGVILVTNAALHNCLIKPGDRGVLVKLTSPLHLEVPSTKLLLVIEGSVILLVAGGSGTTFAVTVEQKEGKQSVEKCEGSTVTDTLVTSTDGSAFVQSGQEAKEGSITFGVTEEAMES